MQKKIELKINEKPLLLTYHYLAFPLGIITAENESGKLPWIFNKYINCSFLFDKQHLKINDDDWMLLNSKVFNGQYCMFNPSILSSEFDFIHFIKCMLLDGYYVLGHFNEFFISCKEPYKKYDFDHDYLIYGYNDEKQELLSIGYTHTLSKYHKFSLKYNEFINASRYIPGTKLNLNLIKLNKKFEYSINIAEIKMQINEYLLSKSTFCGNFDETIYGYKAVVRQIKVLQETVNCNDTMDLRGIRALYELKKIMLMRLEFLKEKDLVNLSEFDIKWYKEFVKQMKSLFKECIKYATKETASIDGERFHNMCFLLAEEKDMLEKVLSLLRINE